MQNLCTTLAALAATVTLATSAQAHANLETRQAQVGASYKAVMRISHGCEGEATHTVKITIPEGFYNAKPMPKPGWKLETVRGAYDILYAAHGKDYPEGVKEIIWSGGNLQDDWFDEFTLRGSFGSDLKAGENFFFPTVQLCENGQHAWTNTSDDKDAGQPAPKLTLTAGKEMMHGDHASRDFTLEDLTLGDPFAFATLPNSPVAGGFLAITNNGDSDDRLIAATSALSDDMQIHEMKLEDDIMKMRELGDGLLAPAGETVALQPGGYHIMFMKLKKPLVEGDVINVTLTFEKSGDIEVPMEVRTRPKRGHKMKKGH